jgi:hypothetical protein
VRPRQARWPKSCIASLAEIFASADGNPGIFNSERRGPNFGAQLVHNNLQMRSFYATESTLNHSKQMKRGVREQGRKISKPPHSAALPPLRGVLSTAYHTTLVYLVLWFAKTSAGTKNGAVLGRVGLNTIFAST